MVSFLTRQSVFTLPVVLAITMGPHASASAITPPFFESFDDAVTDVTLVFNDFSDQVNPADTGINGTNPGWTITGGELVLFDNTNFGDVATALVQVTPIPAQADFSVSADVQIDAIDFTNTRTGIVAMGIDPNNFDQDFSGLGVYVENIGVSGDRYRVALFNDDTLLAESVEFDLTDGTAGFSLSLTGVFQASGDVLLTGTFLDDGGENVVAPLSSLVLGTDIPGGDNFGVRTSIGFNQFEASFDNLQVDVVIPEPTSLTLIGLGGMCLLGRRRRER